jgi:hypothetical protein
MPSSSAAAVTSRAAARSKILSLKMARRPCSMSIRTLRETPDRAASCSWVRPSSKRSSWMRIPRSARRRFHAMTRLGSSWLGRVGTPSSTPCVDTKVCPTSRAKFTGWNHSESCRPRPLLIARKFGSRRRWPEGPTGGRQHVIWSISRRDCADLHSVCRQGDITRKRTAAVEIRTPRIPILHY